MKKLFLLCLVVFGFTQMLYSQQDSIANMVKYSFEFKFKDGIYLKFEDFISNSPVDIKNIVTSKNVSDFYLINSLLDEDEIVYFDKYGLRQRVNTSDIWGFCRGGDVFIGVNGEFYRLPVIGRICHFVASKRVETTAPYTPYYGNYDYRYQQPVTTKTEIAAQFVLDTSTGKIYDFERQNILSLLVPDAELYEEFDNLSNKKQRRKMYYYLRKFNERNPLYIPVNQ